MRRFIILTIIVSFFAAFAVTGAGAQTKRRKNKGLLTNLAIVGGSTAAGAIIGRGRNGAMIGAGAGLLYAASRKGTKRRYANGNYRRAAKIGGGSLLGAGTGAWIGGKKGMIIGSLIGAGATYLYTKNGKDYYRSRNGKIYSFDR